MDIRKQLGGMAEAALNDAIDGLLGEQDSLFDDLGKKIAGELKKLVGDNFKAKLKANYIDKIDGEDDIPDV
jgi:hypothetical protein